MCRRHAGPRPPVDAYARTCRRGSPRGWLVVVTRFGRTRRVNHSFRMTTTHTSDPEDRSRQTTTPLEVIMNQHAATPPLEVPGIPSFRDSARRLTGYWWVLLVLGIAWVAVSLVLLQFNSASVTTIGILVGIMFLAVGVENIALATLDVPMRWLWAVFGVLFVVSAVI